MYVFIYIMSQEIFSCQQMCDPAKGICVLRGVIIRTIETLKDMTDLPLDAQELVARETPRLSSLGCRVVDLATTLNTFDNPDSTLEGY